MIINRISGVMVNLLTSSAVDRELESWPSQTKDYEIGIWMMIMALCSRSTCLVGFLQCKITETTVCGMACHSTLTHYPDSKTTSLCTFSLMLHA
jgi:hypothetical protein